MQEVRVVERAVLSGLRSVWLTSAEGVDHAVTDDEIAAGRVLGRYVALCGATVVAASMSAPPGLRCPRCVVFLRARATLRELGAAPAGQQRGVCARWLGRRGG